MKTHFENASQLLPDFFILNKTGCNTGFYYPANTASHSFRKNYRKLISANFQIGVGQEPPGGEIPALLQTRLVGKSRLDLFCNLEQIGNSRLSKSAAFKCRAIPGWQVVRTACLCR